MILLERVSKSTAREYDYTRVIILHYLRPENILQLYSLSSKVTFQVGLEVLKISENLRFYG